ncbi:alpha/beta hydrolase [Streptomyces sp. NBC_01214]|uniref:alpha/beta fold hydrolase n=1 Tax=Streptomyces sp. NBC_01214 TaxID=2903777 RepID=UPI002255A430|nr:alpha/beta hydrolase [Streptomyces sp. NBC_01214]MCX4803093.1 alpha/beta hydrolase [Streptomyces sp. NBC_01214]
MIGLPGPTGPVVVRRHPGAAAPGAPKALFLHGLAGTDTVWDACGRELSPGLEVWSAQLPWRGQGVPGWAREPDVTHWVEQAVTAVPGPVDVVVAHSMSSNILLELLDRESRAGSDPFARFGIRALVLVSPFYRGSHEEFDWATITHYLGDFHLILQEGIRAHSGGRIPPDTEAAMAERVREWVSPYGWIRFFDLYLRTPQLQTARITVPCLVLGGHHDIAAPLHNAAALTDALPDGRLRILADSGHFPMVDEQTRFVSEIRDFLDGVLVRRPTLHSSRTTET